MFGGGWRRLSRDEMLAEIVKRPINNKLGRFQVVR